MNDTPKQRGGARPGAGRKPSPVTMATRDALDDAISLVALTHERLVLLKLQPAYQPTLAELREMARHREAASLCVNTSEAA